LLYELDGVRQTYAARTVLDVDRLQVSAGEILALVGPSGAGKSTLLRVLNFLEAPAAGRIRFDGREVAHDAPLDVRRQVTMVFQRPILQRADVRTNLVYGLRLRGERPGPAVDELLDRLALTGLTHQPARQLSAGEMQRVALARALLVRPRVLLLDEPTANLDPYNVGLIEDVIRAYNAERRGTVVMVTHNVFQARRLAHRTGLLLAGRMIELCDTHTFFTAPADPRTAAFVVGDMVW
jgi:tungstate transport system ATP-binding protein